MWADLHGTVVLIHSFSTEFEAEIEENNVQGQFMGRSVAPCIKRAAAPIEFVQKKKQENGKSNQMISSQAGLFSFVHIVPRFK
jgi:hypothetical protein